MMRMIWPRRVATVLALSALIAGCERGAGEQATTAAASAAPIGPAECAACGMVVREQPAPRVQVLHRDGTRRYFCSVGDAVRYLESPSPHGEALSTFVEVLSPNADPQRTDPAELEWVKAESASFVSGVERPRIMGPPVLAYRSAGEARRVAQAHAGKVVSWEELRRTLFAAAGPPER